jgi:hypothetical protein
MSSSKKNETTATGKVSNDKLLNIMRRNNDYIGDYDFATRREYESVAEKLGMERRDVLYPRDIKTITYKGKVLYNKPA